MNAYYVPGTILSISHLLTHLILWGNLISVEFRRHDKIILF